MRVTLISDIHLSRARPYFHANWELLLRELAAAPPPDLFLIAGDVALDGPERADDLAFARIQLDRLPAPWRAVPGNHDIGSNHPDLRGEHVVTDAFRAVWTEHLGAAWWQERLGPWLLIGLDSLLPGSGLAAEAEQAAFLEAALAAAEGQRVAVLMHKPLCIHHVTETVPETGCWYPQARALLQSPIREGRIHMLISGHLHEARDRRIAGARHLWLPGLAFVNDMAGEWQPDRGGRKRVGYVTAEIGADWQVTWHEPSRLLNTDIGNWLRQGIGHYGALAGEAEPYPAHPTGD